MPDLDIISRHVPRGWRRPMRLLLNRATPGEEVGRAILRALTACLRENRGFPGFNDFLSVLRARVAGQIDAHSAYTLVDAIERQYAHQRHAKIAGRAAKQMLAEFGQARRLEANLPEALAHRCCRSLIDHNLIGYVTPQTVGKHYPGAAGRRLAAGNAWSYCRSHSGAWHGELHSMLRVAGSGRRGSRLIAAGSRENSSIRRSCEVDMTRSHEPPSYDVRFDEAGAARMHGASSGVRRDDGYQIGPTLFDGFFSSELAPALADMVEVGVAVYTADRMCRRKIIGEDTYRHSWHRRISLTVPVGDPSLWNSEEVQARLRAALTFLTDDEWQFRFTRHEGPSRALQGSLANALPRPPRAVALFSGGLDSLAGFCQEAIHRPEASFVLVSAWTNGRLLRRQISLARAVAKSTGREILPVFVDFGLRRGGSTYNDDERSQRTRGFVHGLLGAAVALAMDEEAVACYENGVGALNLPLSPVQLGAQSARSAHPLALALLAGLVELVTDHRFDFRLPFLTHTKGRLCRAIGQLSLSALVRDTVSCDAFPRRVRGKPQCGWCTSCLLRRQALKVAGLGLADSPGEYEFDVQAPGPRNPDLEWNLRVMLQQVRRLRLALSAPDRWGGLVLAYPALDQTVQGLAALGWDARQLRAGITELYCLYCSEWEHFEQQTLPFVA